MTFVVADSPAEMAACFPVLRQLRMHVTDLDSFVQQVAELSRVIIGQPMVMTLTCHRFSSAASTMEAQLYSTLCWSGG